MKAVAYGIKPFEKEFLAKANHKKHDITLISNALSIETVVYARSKRAVIVSACNEVSEKIIQILAAYGVKHIIKQSASTNPVTKATAQKYGIELVNISGYRAEQTTSATSQAFVTDKQLQMVADKIISNLDEWRAASLTTRPVAIPVDFTGATAQPVFNK